MKTAKRYSHVDCQICQNQKSNFIQNFRGRDFNVLSMYIFELLIFKMWLSFARQQVLSPSSIDHNPESWSITLTDCLTARFYVPITNWEHFFNLCKSFPKVWSRKASYPNANYKTYFFMIYDGRNQVWTCSVAQRSAVWKRFWFVSVETCDWSQNIWGQLLIKTKHETFGTKLRAK